MQDSSFILFLFLTAFVLNVGEDVKITCEFINSSSRTATSKARLLQKQMYYTHGHRQHQMFAQTLARQAGLVGPHSPEAHSELTITIPSTVPLSVSNCAILEVSYVIEVSEIMVVCNACFIKEWEKRLVTTGSIPTSVMHVLSEYSPPAADPAGPGGIQCV